MTITTKFDKGEKAFIIDENRIVCLPVVSISYNSGTVSYSFRAREALTSLDSDKVIHRDEPHCFKSIDELADFYKVALSK